MTPMTLRQENQRFDHTGGVSRHNRTRGFRSAFQDSATGQVYLSRFTDGRLAPIHLLDGLPDELVTARSPTGRVVAVKQSLVAGFLRSNRFYTREQATRLLAQ